MRLAALVVICAAIFGSVTSMVKAASGDTAFVFSSDPAISAEQHSAFGVVHQYEKADIRLVFDESGNATGLMTGREPISSASEAHGDK